jgi:hypothetical protein
MRRASFCIGAGGSEPAAARGPGHVIDSPLLAEGIHRTLVSRPGR